MDQYTVDLQGQEQKSGGCCIWNEKELQGTNEIHVVAKDSDCQPADDRTESNASWCAWSDNDGSIYLPGNKLRT